MTSADVGVSPISSQSGPNYVLAAADANLYQIKAAQLAATRAQRDDVKAYAKRVLAETQSSHKALLAALKNDQRTIKAPSSSLSADRAALLKLLQKAPKSAFDNLYLTQSAQVQQAAWAVNKGYAQDGTDPALQQIAGTAVPVLENELTTGKSLTLRACRIGDTRRARSLKPPSIWSGIRLRRRLLPAVQPAELLPCLTAHEMLHYDPVARDRCLSCGLICVRHVAPGGPRKALPLAHVPPR